MKKTHLFWQLFPSYWVLTIISILAVAIYAFHSTSILYFQTQENDLSTRARLIAQQVRTTSNPDLDSLCKEMGKITDTRFTIILPDGTVAGDSTENPPSMENHAERPEVHQALLGETGTDRRYSHTLKQKMMYVAVPLRDENQQITHIIRAALPTTAIQGELSKMTTRVVDAALLAGVLALMVCIVVVRRITNPLHGMARAARQFADGNFDHNIPTYPAVELDELSDSLNIMSAQLHHLETVRADFVANVSHELKTPITSIQGFVETLLSDDWDHDPDTQRFLEIINQQSSRLNAIIDDLLTLSRLEQKEGQVLKEPCLLESVLSNAVNLCQLQAGKKNINITIDCPENLTLPLNAPLLEQAVVNLIINAIKYSDPDKQVWVIAQQQNNQLSLSVKDEGFGIDRKHLDRLFERFYRVDTARSRKLGGTGLGLSIVKHIAQVHNATVHVESSLGTGSIFTITLPVDA